MKEKRRVEEATDMKVKRKRKSPNKGGSGCSAQDKRTAGRDWLGQDWEGKNNPRGYV